MLPAAYYPCINLAAHTQKKPSMEFFFDESSNLDSFIGPLYCPGFATHATDQGNPLPL